jgi:hypothetical protein
MITLAATTQDGLDGVAKEYLEDRGWVVTKWREWETPKQICERLKVNLSTLNRRLVMVDRPRVEVIRSASTHRLLKVCSNEVFDAYLLEARKSNHSKGDNGQTH